MVFTSFAPSFWALLLLFQTKTPQKRHGGKRVNSGRKSKKRRARSINSSKGCTQKAKLRLHREMYEEKMKKVNLLLVVLELFMNAGY